MEKDNNNLENDEDQKKESKSKKSKNSKSSTSENTETKKSSEDKLIEKDSIKRKDASFFKKKESKQSDNEEEATKESGREEEPGLTEEEVHEATLAIIDSLTQEVADELEAVEPDSAEEFEALADAVYLEELLEIAEGDEDITEESINQAFDETLADLNIQPGIELPEEEPVYEVEASTDDTIIDTDYEPEYDDNLGSEDDNLSQSINTGNPTPPTPPLSTGQSNLGPGGPQIPSTSFSNHANAQPNTLTDPTQVTRNVEIIHGRRSDMLVGAIIGYIVGRRGGRKRTEKKLQPKISKLEEQVTELHYKIINKEAQVRNLARQKVETNSKINQIEKENKSLVEEAVEQRQIKKKVKEQLKRREELSKDPGVEKIGKFSLPALKVFHERRIPDGHENSPKRKQVETMTESELLEKIGYLRIEGYEVKTIYKNGRLGTESLRQITKEYLRGGPYKQTFIRELLRDNQEIEKSREVIKNINSDIGKKNEVNNKINEKSREKISKEEAMKKAEALLMTHTEPVNKPKHSRVLVASFTLLAVVVSAFIILLLS